MSMGKAEWPEVGELVVATVQRVTGYGAYVSLEEYQKEGLLHISEISSRWVRNIRNHVRERQKVVLQVNRIDKTRGQIDLSLRRVSGDERRKKLENWKKDRRAETLLKSVSETLKISESELFEKAGIKLMEAYGSLYEGLEEAAKRGSEALTLVGVPTDISETLAKISKEKIVVKRVTINGVFEITSMDPRGVEEIKMMLLETKKVAEANEAEAVVYTLGAPKYKLEVTAEGYKKAEAALDQIVETVKSSWSGHDGKISFGRE